MERRPQQLFEHFQALLHNVFLDDLEDLVLLQLLPRDVEGQDQATSSKVLPPAIFTALQQGENSKHIQSTSSACFAIFCTHPHHVILASNPLKSPEIVFEGEGRKLLGGKSVGKKCLANKLGKILLVNTQK